MNVKKLNHVVFISRRRKKVIFGQLRSHLGEMFHELVQQEECQIVGYMKGKSAIGIAREFMGCRRNYSGESFWARGY